jgi:hypothetical protein
VKKVGSADAQPDRTASAANPPNRRSDETRERPDTVPAIASEAEIGFLLRIPSISMAIIALSLD